jgi:iron complex outermembrane recepter protein
MSQFECKALTQFRGSQFRIDRMASGATIALLALSSSLAQAASVAPAAAPSPTTQGTQADAPSDSTDTSANGLEEIVVTAQRRSESLQRVPISISALDSGALTAVGFKQPNDLANVVSGLQVQNVYGKFQPIFSIRGINQSDYSSLQESPIGVYADEAYIGETFLHGLNFFDLQRVEVLKGPQGTLYGKNTTGGAINIISRTPAIDADAQANFTVGYGNYGAGHFDGGFEKTLVPGVLAARLAVFYDHDDGYQRNVTLGTRLGQTASEGLRATLVFQPIDTLSTTLRYTHGDTDQQSTLPRSIGSYPVGPGGELVDFGGYSRPASLDFYDVESDLANQPLSIQYDLVSLSTTWKGPGFNIISISSYHSARKRNTYDNDGGLADVAVVRYDNDTAAYSQDTRLETTSGDNWSVIIGGYYGHERNAGESNYELYQSPLTGLQALYTPSDGAPTAAAIADFVGQLGNLDQLQTLTHESYALYSQARWDVTPTFGVDAGARYTRDKDAQVYYNTSRYLSDGGTPLGSYIPGNVTAGTATPVNAPYAANLSEFLDGPYTTASVPYESVTNGRVTGKLGADYRPTSDLMLYASYSRGYRSGNFNSGLTYLALTPAQGGYAKPETIDAYEGGIKSEFLDHRIRANAAAFWYNYKDQQFVDVEGISATLQNAGSSKIKGVEGDLKVLALPGLELSLGATFLNAKYTSLNLINLDLSGNQLISAPKVSTTAAIDYGFAVTEIYTLQAHVDASYRTHQWYSAFNGITIPDGDSYKPIGQSGYAVANGRLTLGIDKNLAISAWAKNLLDKRYVSYAIDLHTAFGDDYFLDGPPRTFGLELSYHY